MNKETERAILAALDASGCTYSVQFVPKTFASNEEAMRAVRGDDWEASAYSFLVTIAGRRDRLVTPYNMGTGHFVQIPQSLYRGRVVMDDMRHFEAYRKTQETGFLHTVSGSKTVWCGRVVKSSEKIAPDITGVMSCLWMGFEALDMTHAEWCAEFGFDTDSIKGRAAYDTQVADSLALKRMLTDESIAAIAAAVEDY